MQKLDTAMGKLSPAGRRFAKFIFSLRQHWYDFRASLQEALLPPVQRALTRFMQVYGGRMTRFFTKMAGTAGGLFETLGKAMEGPAFRQFFVMMDRFGPKLLRQFGKTSINWLKIFARFMTLSAPLALKLSKALLHISRAILKWSQSKDGTETIQKFLDYTAKVGPIVADFFWNLVKAIVNIMEAMAPWGELVLKGLDAFVRLIANMDTKTLGLVIGIIVGLVIAFQAANLAVFIFYGAFSALLNPVGLVAFAIVAVVAIVAVLYTRFESVRKIVDSVVRYIKWGWTTILIPLMKALAAAIVWLIVNIFVPYWTMMFKIYAAVFRGMRAIWTNVLWPTIKVIAKVLGWLWHNVFAPVFKAIWTIVKTAFGVIKALWNKILWPILDLIGTVIWKLWTAYWRPAISKAKALWKDFTTGLKFLWDKYGQPFMDTLIDKVIPKLQTAWEKVVEAIGTAWALLKKYVAEPIFAVVDLILNKGIIAGFNQIARFVGSTPMDPISLPFTDKGEAVKAQKHADGGVLRGYTPGRDVHKFYSSTGGALELSGGEAIMRPEWTAAMGKQNIDYWNSLARSRGVNGVREAMTHRFAKGGVLKNPDAPVTYGGKKIAAIFAAQMALVAKLGGPSWYLMQGGYGGNAGNDSYSGSSHDYPGVGDLGRAGLSFDDQAWARKVGLFGWARNISGAATAGSGAHVHALSAFSPGTRKSPQYSAYLAGQDGLGGSDYGPRPKMLSNITDLLAGFDLSNLGATGKMVQQHHYPDLLAKIVKAPGEWARSLVAGPLEEFTSKFHTPFAEQVAKIPGQLIPDMAKHVMKMIPAVSAFNAAGKLIKGDHGSGTKGGSNTDEGTSANHTREVALRNGGVIPYNGTMKYDAGGYLPPGLTSVVNLTGRPEPVFTRDQLDAGVGGGEVFHYEPHFEGSNLTASDVVRDMDHERRRMRHMGKYARNH
jgi:hypothetical protein